MRARIAVELPIRLLQHKNSEFFVALSDKFPGVLAHGKNVDELLAELENVLRYLLAQDGYNLIEIRSPDDTPEFLPQMVTATAEPLLAA